MQHPDLAIKDKENDKLNFLPFAQKVAKGIKNYKQNETFIISIEGKWGSGKTSLMNLIENEIKDDVEIMHFNPWLLTDIRQVINLFFDELIKVLCYGSFKAKWNEDIKKDLKALASILLPDNINVDIGLIKLGYKPKDAFIKNDESLEKIKSRINGYLKKLYEEFGKKIVIIVDDIDRLTDEETEFIFRLTKGIADFDNLIYILLYDKGIVAKSLQTFKNENGEKYLEKIVQYSLHVPKPHRLTLNKLLFQKLNEILDNLEKEEGNQIFFDEDKWSIVVDKVLTKYILTVRDINSIINIVSFEYPIVVEDVNFTDFFLLILLRVKNNNLYEFIYENKNKFLSDEKSLEDNFRIYLDEQKEFKNILELLFPNLKKNLHPELASKYDIANDHKNKYLTDIYYFENYFSLSIPEDKLAYKDFKEVENTILDTNFDNFRNKILEIDKQRKSSLFLEMFEQNSLEKINEQEKLENAFYYLINISYQLEEGKFDKYYNFMNIKPLIKCESIAFKILKKIKEIEVFIKIFFFEKDEIPLIIKIDIFQDIKDENSIYKLKISDDIKEEIFKFLKNKLEKFSLNDLFSDKYNEIYIFSGYKYFEASFDRISKEINEYIFKSNDNFFKILEKFKYWQLSSNGSEWLIDKKTLKELVDLEEVQKYIDCLDKEIKIEYKELLEIWDRKSHFYN
ncbi:KAP family P-loop NTPase fold protein [Aliarcobacter butzleri]|uniref:KAP family P-loop NTPase fold protein n=1 Tax=Aliarcobacter butzleri TaxID=28197 RepID=UPI00215B23CF|nr:KAP family NTPase [Aliarcobacter butzleri]MCR8711192.1 KAP family NTPase [Aliarcobacter butzleri]